MKNIIEIFDEWREKQMSKFGKWKLDIRVGCLAVYPEEEYHNCFSGITESFIHYKGGKAVYGKYNNGKERFKEYRVDSKDIERARLIAAAPDLYEACKAAMDYYEMLEKGTGVEHGCLKLLRAAIAEADGAEGE